MEEGDHSHNAQRPQEEAAGSVPASLLQDEEPEDFPALQVLSENEDGTDEDLDLDNLSSYPLTTLQQYCKDEGLSILGNTKESVIATILAYNGEDSVLNTKVTTTTTTQTSTTKKATPERDEKKWDTGRKKQSRGGGGAEGRLSAAQYLPKDRKKTKGAGKKKRNKRGDDDERLMYEPPSWRCERGGVSLFGQRLSEEDQLALAIKESLRESGSPKPEPQFMHTPDKREKREKKKPWHQEGGGSSSRDVTGEKDTDKRSGNRNGKASKRAAREKNGNEGKAKPKKANKELRKKPEEKPRSERKKTDRTQTAALELEAQPSSKEKNGTSVATAPTSDRESLLRSDEEFAKALHESLNGRSESRLAESIRQQLMQSSDSDVTSSSDTDEDDDADVVSIDIDAAHRGMLSMLEALGLTITPTYAPSSTLTLPGSSAWHVPPALVPDRTSFINTLIATHQRRIDPDRMSYEELLALQEQIGDVKKKGLTQATILSNSQTLTFQQISEDEEKDTNCPICLMEFVEGDEIRKLRCVHVYHKDCIDKWLEHHETCCVCMRPLHDPLMK
eukprot:TRINITY_DN3440_c0_g1_i1.p1 TRINITY_DN3440_c0_g1~~TRINITY_DN3440_c0_g1_i1.p1  ORF type:complete len:561 (-),score=114.04 TRINITY_DN3440_c0_g1_i1:75-1757(-)